MMAPTHMLAGAVLAVPVMYVAPEFASVAVIAGILGGFFPDLDMYWGHRRSLHYPVYYTVGAVLLIPLTALLPLHVLVGITIAVSAAALHSVMDIFGGGLELYPWHATSNRAVYNHYHARWIGPQRWIRYDGSPEDFGLTIFLAGMLLPLVDGEVRLVVLGTVGVAALYVALRKTLPRLAERIVFKLPCGVWEYLPARYLPTR